MEVRAGNVPPGDAATAPATATASANNQVTPATPSRKTKAPDKETQKAASASKKKKTSPIWSEGQIVSLKSDAELNARATVLEEHAHTLRAILALRARKSGDQRAVNRLSTMPKTPEKPTSPGSENDLFLRDSDDEPDASHALKTPATGSVYRNHLGSCAPPVPEPTPTAREAIIRAGYLDPGTEQGHRLRALFGMCKINDVRRWLEITGWHDEPYRTEKLRQTREGNENADARPTIGDSNQPMEATQPFRSGGYKRQRSPQPGFTSEPGRKQLRGRSRSPQRSPSMYRSRGMGLPIRTRGGGGGGGGGKKRIPFRNGRSSSRSGADEHGPSKSSRYREHEGGNSRPRPEQLAPIDTNSQPPANAPRGPAVDTSCQPPANAPRGPAAETNRQPSPSGLAVPNKPGMWTVGEGYFDRPRVDREQQPSSPYNGPRNQRRSPSNKRPLPARYAEVPDHPDKARGTVDGCVGSYGHPV